VLHLEHSLYDAETWTLQTYLESFWHVVLEDRNQFDNCVRNEVSQ